jgi:cobalt-zinc-cadmium efflux system outer membrane protein
MFDNSPSMKVRLEKTMNHSFLVIVALTLVLPALGQRASPSVLDPVGGQTSEDLVARALAQNGEILAGGRQVAAARGGVTQAALKANPSVAFSDSQEIAGGQNNFMIGASLPLELYHRRQRRIEVAKSAVDMTEFDQAERERRLRAEVESKVGEVLASARNLQVAEDLLAVNRQALDLTQTRADKGAVPPLDADLLRVEVNRIDARRVELEARLGVSMLELKSLVGMKPEEDLRLKGSLEGVFAGRDSAIQQVLETRPDILSARAAEQVASARLRQVETDARPDASISANYQRMDSSFNVNGLDAAGQLRPVQGVFHFATVGVSINLPVRNRNQGAIETAVAQMDEAKRRREYAELIVTREVAAAVLSLEKAQEGLRIFREGVRRPASQNLEVVRKTYVLGRTQLLDVIAEQRRFIDIEMEYTDALNRYYQAAVRVHTVTGGR